MRISDWSSDVCSSDLVDVRPDRGRDGDADGDHAGGDATGLVRRSRRLAGRRLARTLPRLQHWPGTGVAALPYAGASVRAGLIRAARVARPEPPVLSGAAEAASSSPGTLSSENPHPGSATHRAGTAWGDTCR